MPGETNPPIIIATKDEKDIWISIITRALYEDEIKFDVLDKYLPKAERFLKFLRRFGWIESKRENVNAYNVVCIYNNKGECINEEANIIVGEKGMICNESTRRTCKFYKKKFKSPLEVNRITIRPIPGILSLGDG